MVPERIFQGPGLRAGHPSNETTGFVEARLVGDQPADAMPFWLALEAVRGAVMGEGYAGAWMRSPIHPGDLDTEDLELDAQGTWTIAPP